MKLTNPFNSLDLRQPESKEELLHSLTAIKNEVKSLYAATDFTTAVGKTEHPDLKFFSALEWLHFGEMHIRHHLRQKERIDDKLFVDASAIPSWRCFLGY